MKIMHILSTLNLGGAETFCINLCNELANNPNNQLFLCILDTIDENSILRKKISNKVHLINIKKEGGYSFSSIIKIYREISLINPDVIHTHLRTLVYVFLSAIYNKIPIVHTVHSLADKEVSNSVQKLYKILFNYFDVMPVGISDKVMLSMQAIYGNKFRTIINNGVPKPKISPNITKINDLINCKNFNENTKIFVNVANINDNKNQKMLIEAFNMLSEKGYEFLLLLIGQAVSDAGKLYLEKCKTVAKENILFIGAVENVGDYLSVADAFCLSSKYEGLPLAILEAMSLGRPILSTPCGGVVDVIVENYNGLLTKDFEAESYVEILEDFYNKSKFNSDNIKKLYQENYSMSICANDYILLYQSRITKKK